MVDLSEFVGDAPQLVSLQKKRQKAQEALDKLEKRRAPLLADIAMYDEMMMAIRKRLSIAPALEDAPEEKAEAVKEEEKVTVQEESGQQSPDTAENGAENSRTVTSDPHAAEEAALAADLAKQPASPPAPEEPAAAKPALPDWAAKPAAAAKEALEGGIDEMPLPAFLGGKKLEKTPAQEEGEAA